jgi:hypothetical protein
MRNLIKLLKIFINNLPNLIHAKDCKKKMPEAVEFSFVFLMQVSYFENIVNMIYFQTQYHEKSKYPSRLRLNDRED